MDNLRLITEIITFIVNPSYQPSSVFVVKIFVFRFPFSLIIFISLSFVLSWFFCTVIFHPTPMSLTPIGNLYRKHPYLFYDSSSTYGPWKNWHLCQINLSQYEILLFENINLVNVIVPFPNFCRKFHSFSRHELYKFNHDSVYVDIRIRFWPFSSHPRCQSRRLFTSLSP